jgi:hypothetical protein
LNFLGNHSLDFKNIDIYDLEYYAITELRKLDIPDEIYLSEYDYLNSRFEGQDMSKSFNMDTWYPVSFPDIPGIRKIFKRNVVTFGPMGMHIFITPDHISLPSSHLEPMEWYSPQNKEKVLAWRSFYFSIINLFGGDHVLYVFERIADNHYHTVHEPFGTSLSVFEQYLISRYGESKKTLFNYPHGKYPRFYIDNFDDIKESQNCILQETRLT